MEIIFLTLAGFAALVHVYIFVLETFLWTKPATMSTFGITKKQAEATKEMAANQGVYNGTLAAVVFAGIGMTMAGSDTAGDAVILAGVAVMATAAVYLFVSSPTKRAAATKQLLFPLCALVSYGILNLL